jgi:transcription initiation factor IIE alpha subunit
VTQVSETVTGLNYLFEGGIRMQVFDAILERGVNPFSISDICSLTGASSALVRDILDKMLAFKVIKPAGKQGKVVLYENDFDSHVRKALMQLIGSIQEGRRDVVVKQVLETAFSSLPNEPKQLIALPVEPATVALPVEGPQPVGEKLPEVTVKKGFFEKLLGG